MWLNGAVDPADEYVSTARTVHRIGLGLLVVSGVAALSGAVYLDAVGLRGQAALLTVAAVVATALAMVWWLHRGTRPGRSAALALAPTAYLTWLLTDNITGFPLVAVAVGAVVLEFGTRGGLIMGGGLLAATAALYLTPPVPASDVLVANLVLLAVLVALGLLVAALVAQLERARTLADQAVRARRVEALAELDRALATERMDQARALHDDLGQRLTLIGMALDLAMRRRATSPEAAWDDVDQARTTAADALSELRTLVRALSPLTADDAAQDDLDSALERLAGVFTGTGLSVTLVRSPSTDATAQLDPLAYRIIQEGLTNVVRHSDARHVKVVLDAGPEHVVRVIDDGTGRTRAPSGFGLRNLQARVEAVGGTFHAEATAEGFVLAARYPTTVSA